MFLLRFSFNIDYKLGFHMPKILDLNAKKIYLNDNEINLQECHFFNRPVRISYVQGLETADGTPTVSGKTANNYCYIIIDSERADGFLMEQKRYDFSLLKNVVDELIKKGEKNIRFVANFQVSMPDMEIIFPKQVEAFMVKQEHRVIVRGNDCAVIDVRDNLHGEVAACRLVEGEKHKDMEVVEEKEKAEDQKLNESEQQKVNTRKRKLRKDIFEDSASDCEDNYQDKNYNPNSKAAQNLDLQRVLKRKPKKKQAKSTPAKTHKTPITRNIINVASGITLAYGQCQPHGKRIYLFRSLKRIGRRLNLSGRKKISNLHIDICSELSSALNNMLQQDNSDAKKQKIKTLQFLMKAELSIVNGEDGYKELRIYYGAPSLDVNFDTIIIAPHCAQYRDEFCKVLISVQDKMIFYSSSFTQESYEDFINRLLEETEISNGLMEIIEKMLNNNKPETALPLHYSKSGKGVASLSMFSPAVADREVPVQSTSLSSSSEVHSTSSAPSSPFKVYQELWYVPTEKWLICNRESVPNPELLYEYIRQLRNINEPGVPNQWTRELLRKIIVFYDTTNVYIGLAARTVSTDEDKAAVISNPEERMDLSQYSGLTLRVLFKIFNLFIEGYKEKIRNNSNLLNEINNLVKEMREQAEKNSNADKMSPSSDEDEKTELSCAITPIPDFSLEMQYFPQLKLLVLTELAIPSGSAHFYEYTQQLTSATQATNVPDQINEILKKIVVFCFKKDRTGIGIAKEVSAGIDKNESLPKPDEREDLSQYSGLGLTILFPIFTLLVQGYQLQMRHDLVVFDKINNLARPGVPQAPRSVFFMQSSAPVENIAEPAEVTQDRFNGMLPPRLD